MTNLSRGASTCALVAALVALCSSPAFADHSAPSGLGGSGASLAVISPDTLSAGKAAAGFRLNVNLPQRRSDSELAELAEREVHADDTDYTAIGSLGFAYGLTDWLTISAELPYVIRHNLRAGEHDEATGIASVERIGSVSGVGDLNVIAKARVVNAHPFALAVLGGIKAPTGSTRKRSNDGERIEVEHQPGTGSWDPLAGIAASVELGALNLGGSALYQWSGKGALATQLGDRARAGLSLSRRLGKDDGHDEGGTDAHGHAAWDLFADLTGEREGRERVAGEVEADSGGKVLWLAPGARFTSNNGWSAAGSVGFPLWQDIRPSHPDNGVRVIVAIGRAF